MHFRLGSARVDVEVVKIFIAVGVEVVVLALGIVVLFWLLDSVLCILAFYFLFLFQPLPSIFNFGFNSVKLTLFFFLLLFATFVQVGLSRLLLFKVALWVTFTWFYLQWEIQKLTRVFGVSISA